MKTLHQLISEVEATANQWSWKIVEQLKRAAQAVATSNERTPNSPTVANLIAAAANFMKFFDADESRPPVLTPNWAVIQQVFNAYEIPAILQTITTRLGKNQTPDPRYGNLAAMLVQKIPLIEQEMQKRGVMY